MAVDPICKMDVDEKSAKWVSEYKGKKYRVPKILLSGHQAKIEEWKKRKR